MVEKGVDGDLQERIQKTDSRKIHSMIEEYPVSPGKEGFRPPGSFPISLPGNRWKVRPYIC